MRGSPDARQHGGHARERRHAEREHRVARLHLVARHRGHAHASVGERRSVNVGRVALRHECALEPLGVAQEVLAAAAAPGARPRRSAPTPRASPHRRRGEVGVLPVGAQQHVRRHQRAPGAHRLAEHDACRMRESVRGDREPEGPGADDRGIDRFHVSQPSRSPFLLASAGARARSRLRRGTPADRPGERDHRCRRACAWATPTPRPTTPA